MEWLAKLPFVNAILEKWIGRIVVVALAAVGGWLAKANLPADVTANWVSATTALLQAAVPIVVAWLLGLLRYKIALNKLPPQK